MAAQVRITERNGAAPGTVTHGVTNLNFGNADVPNLVHTAHPIRRGLNSFDKWWRLEWHTGAANRLSNFRFWRSDALGGSGAALPAGISIFCAVGSAADLVYSTPTTAVFTGQEVPSTEATALSVGPAQLTSVGSTFFIRAQMRTALTAATGDVPVVHFTFSYNEE